MKINYSQNLPLWFISFIVVIWYSIYIKKVVKFLNNEYLIETIIAEKNFNFKILFCNFILSKYKTE